MKKIISCEQIIRELGIGEETFKQWLNEQRLGTTGQSKPQANDNDSEENDAPGDSDKKNT